MVVFAPKPGIESKVCSRVDDRQCFEFTFLFVWVTLDTNLYNFPSSTRQFLTSECTENSSWKIRNAYPTKQNKLGNHLCIQLQSINYKQYYKYGDTCSVHHRRPQFSVMLWPTESPSWMYGCASYCGTCVLLLYMQKWNGPWQNTCV